MGAYRAFADLLSYPDGNLLAHVDRCLKELAGAPSSTSEAGATPGRLLLAFRETAERLGTARLEDAYTAAFDLDPACSLYLGHHLFGENARRGIFMFRLVQLYREAGFAAPAGEPPDHLPVVLRYVDLDPTAESMQEILSDAVVPVTGRLLEALVRIDHCYVPVVRALFAHAAGAVDKPGGQETPV